MSAYEPPTVGNPVSSFDAEKLAQAYARTLPCPKRLEDDVKALREAVRIVRDLAADDDPTYAEELDLYCAYCGRPCVRRVITHREECLWVRAVEWVKANPE